MELQHYPVEEEDTAHEQTAEVSSLFLYYMQLVFAHFLEEIFYLFIHFTCMICIVFPAIELKSTFSSLLASLSLIVTMIPLCSLEHMINVHDLYRFHIRC